MVYTPSPQLLRALRLCLNKRARPRCPHYPLSRNAPKRSLQTATEPPLPPQAPPVPLRKQLKDEAKARKLANTTKDPSSPQKAPKSKTSTKNDKWELTVGIEIHAELNTARKLFSPALTSLNDPPNTHVSVFDAAMPGAQPQFQKETLLPALRAAIALGCEVQRKSSWDRKHYFHWDQPNGYQITQYYQPFATNGTLTLHPHDDIDPSDHPSITIGIKQIQMEQDTAKTVLQPPSTHLLDFNRVSHPLIEIITLPQIHSPRTAAAVVRKIQSILKAVGACETGMEMGGLRADVNVSVRRTDVDGQGGDGNANTHSYAGVTNLGQRTEIKNLSSLKAVSDAITAESARQIALLESGGTVQGETRGWTLGSTETKRLRGKEGEVDYRYMPDPDLGAVVIGDDLIAYLKETLPTLPDEMLTVLTEEEGKYGLTMKDAKTLISLDDGDRVDYYYNVVHQIHDQLEDEVSGKERQKAGKLAANWILHHLPTDAAIAAETAKPLAELLVHLLRAQITLPTAKTLLPRLLADSEIAIPDVLTEENLLLQPMSEEEYRALAEKVVAENAGMADKARAEAAKGKGKIMWFVGQMVRLGEEGRVQPERADGAVRAALGLS